MYVGVSIELMVIDFSAGARRHLLTYYTLAVGLHGCDLNNFLISLLSVQVRSSLSVGQERSHTDHRLWCYWSVLDAGAGG